MVAVGSMSLSVKDGCHAEGKLLPGLEFSCVLNAVGSRCFTKLTFLLPWTWMHSGKGSMMDSLRHLLLLLLLLRR